MTPSKKPRKVQDVVCPKCGSRDWKLIVKCSFVLHAVCQVCGYKDEVMGYVNKEKVVV